MPRVATIASWLGKFAPSCALAGILGIQIGVVPPLGGYLFLLIGLVAALFSVGFGTAAVIATRSNKEGSGRAAGWLGLSSGMVMLTLTIVGIGNGGGSPPINDITTDVEHPPSFAAASEVPDFEGRDMSYPADFVAIVEKHYSYLESLHVDQQPISAYEKAIATSQSLGWEIVHQDPDQLTINARETSFLFKFVDDIVIRVQPDGSGAVVDLRSKSRDGRGDLGVNAARIVAFTQAFGR